jgi:hypothetical protein
MKFLRNCFFLLLTISFASCWPNGNKVSDTLNGTPTKADTVLPHKFHPGENSASTKNTEENVPTFLKR